MFVSKGDVHMNSNDYKKLIVRIVENIKDVKILKIIYEFLSGMGLG